MIPLALIRHGPTVWNEQGLLQGRRDLPLSAAGRDAVARWRLPQRVSNLAWVSSPLLRCRETADLLGLGTVPTEPRLIEIDWGDWEGPEGARLRADTPRPPRTTQGGLDLRPPAGESPREVLVRLRPWLIEVVRGGVPTGAVTHKGVIRCLYALATGWAMQGKMPDQLRWDCAHFLLVEPDGSVRVDQLNVGLLAQDAETAT